MGRIYSERPDTHPFDRSVTADVLLRQEPEEEEEEDEGNGNGGHEEEEEEEEEENGYSE